MNNLISPTQHRNIVCPMQMITINYVRVIDYINSYIGILSKTYNVIIIHVSYAGVRLFYVDDNTS